MRKINIFITLALVASSIVFAGSEKWGLKKPSPHMGIEKTLRDIADSGQSLSISFSSLSTSGDLSSDYESGSSIDFMINCNKTCSILNKDFNVGLAFGVSPMSSEESDVNKLTMGSIGMYLNPNLNLPVDFSFGAGVAEGPGDFGVGKMGYISMNLFYSIPKCENWSFGLQYKQYMNPEDGEINFSKLGTLGLGFKIDG